jgi:hypothetical protein
MSGDIIRIKRLDIYRYAATGFEYTITFFPDLQEFFKIYIPFVSIILGILGVGMTEVVRGRCDNEINTVLRDVGQNLPCIPANNSVYKRMDFGRFKSEKTLIGIF